MNGTTAILQLTNEQKENQQPVFLNMTGKYCPECDILILHQDKDKLPSGNWYGIVSYLMLWSIFFFTLVKVKLPFPRQSPFI